MANRRPKLSTEIIGFSPIFVKHAFKACNTPFITSQNVNNSWIKAMNHSSTKVYRCGLYYLMGFSEKISKIQIGSFVKQSMSGKPIPEAKITVPKFCEEEGFYTTAQRSQIMSKIRGKNTKPEILLKKALWHAGLRHRINKQKLPGNPDIAFVKYKVLFFIDDAFWHGYDWEKRKDNIKTNRDFWQAKIERNMQRDRDINRYYAEKGWTVFRIWDFAVKKENLDTLVDRIRKAMGKEGSQ